MFEFSRSARWERDVAIQESFNRVVDLARDLGHPELKKALMEVREELKALIAENQRLREEQKSLKALVEKSDDGGSAARKVKFERGAYWRIEEEGTLRGPMCRRCWESKQDLHPLVQQMQSFFMCPDCGFVARLPGVRPA